MEENDYEFQRSGQKTYLALIPKPLETLVIKNERAKGISADELKSHSLILGKIHLEEASKNVQRLVLKRLKFDHDSFESLSTELKELELDQSYLSNQAQKSLVTLGEKHPELSIFQKLTEIYDSKAEDEARIKEFKSLISQNPNLQKPGFLKSLGPEFLKSLGIDLGSLGIGPGND